jgi:hypothetical protein
MPTWSSAKQKVHNPKNWLTLRVSKSVLQGSVSRSGYAAFLGGADHKLARRTASEDLHQKDHRLGEL